MRRILEWFYGDNFTPLYQICLAALWGSVFGSLGTPIHIAVAYYLGWELLLYCYSQIKPYVYSFPHRVVYLSIYLVFWNFSRYVWNPHLRGPGGLWHR